MSPINHFYVFVVNQKEEEAESPSKRFHITNKKSQLRSKPSECILNAKFYSFSFLLESYEKILRPSAATTQQTRGGSSSIHHDV